MPASLPLPPVGSTDPILWQNYYLALQNAVATGNAPSDARYWVSTADVTLTNEVNFGGLGTGYVYSTVAAGISTPSILPGVPAVDITGILPVDHGGSGADLTLTGGASQVVKQETVGGDFTVAQLTTADISGITIGTYTPTLTNVANLDGSTAYVCGYARLGAFVIVQGKVAADPTAAAQTQLGISLPVASNLASDQDCTGTAAASGIAGQSAAILGDTVNDRAVMQWQTVDTTNQPMYFVFAYQIKS